MGAVLSLPMEENAMGPNGGEPTYRGSTRRESEGSGDVRRRKPQWVASGMGRGYSS